MSDRFKLAALLTVALISLGALGVVVYNFVLNDWRLDGDLLDLSFIFGDDDDDLEQDSDERTSVRAFSFGDSIRTVSVETLGLRVAVTSSTSRQIHLTLSLNGDATDSTRFVTDVSARSGRLGITAAPTGALGNASGLIEVALPSGIHLDVRSGSGDIAVQNIEGTIDLRAQKGSIELTGISGRLSCLADEGDIALEGCRLDSADIRASGVIAANLCDGAFALDATRVSVTRHFGSLRATARAGIHAALLTTDSPVHLVSDEGDIRLHVLPGARFAYEVDAPVGTIVSNVAFDSLGSENATKHALRATTNGGGVPAVLRAKRGNVEIVLHRSEETRRRPPDDEAPARNSAMDRRALLTLSEGARWTMEGS